MRVSERDVVTRKLKTKIRSRHSNRRYPRLR
jgi:hypothetical protein